MASAATPRQSRTYTRPGPDRALDDVTDHERVAPEVDVEAVKAARVGRRREDERVVAEAEIGDAGRGAQLLRGLAGEGEAPLGDTRHRAADGRDARALAQRVEDQPLPRGRGRAQVPALGGHHGPRGGGRGLLDRREAHGRSQAGGGDQRRGSAKAPAARRASISSCHVVRPPPSSCASGPPKQGADRGVHGGSREGGGAARADPGQVSSRRTMAGRWSRRSPAPASARCSDRTAPSSNANAPNSGRELRHPVGVGHRHRVDRVALAAGGEARVEERLRSAR